MGSEILHLSQVPRRWGYCYFMGHTLSSKYLVGLFVKMSSGKVTGP